MRKHFISFYTLISLSILVILSCSTSTYDTESTNYSPEDVQSPPFSLENDSTPYSDDVISTTFGVANEWTTSSSDLDTTPLIADGEVAIASTPLSQHTKSVNSENEQSTRSSQDEETSISEDMESTSISIGRENISHTNDGRSTPFAIKGKIITSNVGDSTDESGESISSNNDEDFPPSSSEEIASNPNDEESKNLDGSEEIISSNEDPFADSDEIVSNYDDSNPLFKNSEQASASNEEESTPLALNPESITSADGDSFEFAVSGESTFSSNDAESNPSTTSDIIFANDGESTSFAVRGEKISSKDDECENEDSAIFSASDIDSSSGKSISQGRTTDSKGQPKDTNGRKLQNHPRTGRRLLGRTRTDEDQEMDNSLGMHKLNTTLKLEQRGRNNKISKDQLILGRPMKVYEVIQELSVQNPNRVLKLETSRQKGRKSTLTPTGRKSSPACRSKTLSTSLAAMGVSDESTYHTDLDAILNGVSEVCPNCQPGLIAVYGNNAFPIISGVPWYDNDVKQPVAAAARFGKGRIVAFGEDKFIHFDDKGDTDKFLLNCINWASEKYEESPIPKKRVGILAEANAVKTLIEFVNNDNYNSKFIQYETLQNKSALQGSFDILIIPDMHTIKADVVSNLKNYVRDGGAVLAACRIYNDPPDLPVNDFLKETGMIWIPHLAQAGQSSKLFNASKELLKNTHAGWVANDIVKLTNSKHIPEESLWTQMAATIRYNLIHGNKSDMHWIDNLKRSLVQYCTSNKTLLNPSPENPVESNNSTRFKVSLEALMYDVLDPDEIAPHPSSYSFPGGIDPQILKQPNTLKITIPLTNGFSETGSSWKWTNPSYGYSTGLYAPAGSKITLEIQGEPVFKFEVKIGCHKDDLSKKSKWVRYPVITTEQAFSGNSAVLASPFGGLLYIQNMECQKCNESLQKLTIEVTGAIRTASFVLNQTSLVEWKDTIRHLKAPWAEFVSDSIALSIPGDLAQGVDDPEELMTFWQDVVNEMSDLIDIPRGENFQRIAFDIDISKGYMHSGKPIMAFLPSANDAVNISVIKRPIGDSWALYHELGHNHINYYHKEWTFDGGGEVTNNIFPLYILNSVLGFSMEESRENLTPERIRMRVEAYVGNGTNYKDHFVDNPDLGLLFYYQLQQIYGWDPFRSVLKGYRNLSVVLTENDQKIDTWLVMFSTTVERNLAALFRSWGIPISAKAEAKVAHFPDSGYLITSLLDDLA